MIGSFHWPINESRTKDLIVANQHTGKTLFFSSECSFQSFFSKNKPKTTQTTHQRLEKIQSCQLTQKYIST